MYSCRCARPLLLARLIYYEGLAISIHTAIERHTQDRTQDSFAARQRRKPPPQQNSFTKHPRPATYHHPQQPPRYVFKSQTGYNAFLLIVRHIVYNLSDCWADQHHNILFSCVLCWPSQSGFIVFGYGSSADRRIATLGISRTTGYIIKWKGIEIDK